MMELQQLILQRPSWLEHSDKAETITLDTRISLMRNLEHFPFPARASLLEKQQVFQTVSQVIEEKKLLGEKFHLLNLQEISDIAKTLLFERNLINFSMIQSVGDRGALVSPKGLTVAINGINHLEIFNAILPGQQKEGWIALDAIDTILGEELTYAYDEKQGFLLSQSNESGTGLSLASTLHLPGLLLTSTINQVLSGVTQMGLTAEGKFRNGSDSWGSLFMLTSGAFAGENEDEILEKHTLALQEVETYELEAREKLFKEASTEIEDKVWRSYGILQHSRILSVPQLLNLSSAIRLGIERGIIDSLLSMDTLNGLITSALQGGVALLMEQERTADTDDLDRQRAEIVRTLLQ